MKVITPKKVTDRTTSIAVSTRKGRQRSVPPRPAPLPRTAAGRCRSRANATRTAGGMKYAVAPTPWAASAGVARTGARKKPTLPPAAKTLMAAVLSPAPAAGAPARESPASATSRAALPAAGWNIATPRPDSRISAHTAGYGPASPDSPRPSPATATPTAASPGSGRRSTSIPTNGCGTELPSAAAIVSPDAAR
jgi:hypothetical protein